jgi:hypothetical protein
MPWLLDRHFAHDDQPTPRFAFQGTVGGDPAEFGQRGEWLVVDSDIW